MENCEKSLWKSQIMLIVKLSKQDKLLNKGSRFISK